MIMLNLPPQLEEAVISMAQMKNMQTEEYIIDCLQKNIPVDDVPFNYDLERMKEMMDTDFIQVPDHALNDFQSFDQWLKDVAK